MQSFDQSLMKLYREGLVTYEEAIRNSTTPTEFELRVKGIHASSDTSWNAFEAKPDAAGQGQAEGATTPPAKAATRASALDRLTKDRGKGPAGINRF
jgi:twitching motility protein PilT